MPSVRYFNQTAPFWDFIADLESTGGQHPFFQAYNPEPSHDAGDSEETPRDQSAAPEAAAQGAPTDPQSSHHAHPHHPHYGHPYGPGLSHGGHHGGPHPRGGPNRFRRGGRCGGLGGAGGWGGGAGHPFGGWGGRDFDLNKIGEFFASQFGLDDTTSNNNSNSNNNNNNTANKNNNSSKDFSPPADVFDTEDAYILHISLPGAKKEDVGVNWDADKSELGVAGVIYRPGDEDFLKQLALDERTVGVFEKKVRLGSRASPAQVDVDAIAAKMEDGVLVVTIPKLDREYVEVKKVDVE